MKQREGFFLLLMESATLRPPLSERRHACFSRPHEDLRLAGRAVFPVVVKSRVVHRHEEQSLRRKVRHSRLTGSASDSQQTKLSQQPEFRISFTAAGRSTQIKVEKKNSQSGFCKIGQIGSPCCRSETGCGLPIPVGKPYASLLWEMSLKSNLHYL
jgi:hypothetical protein